MADIVALDIGGTKVSGALISLDDGGFPAVGPVRSIPTEPRRGGADLLARVVELARTLVTDSAGGVVALGIGSAGVVDPETGEILSATDLIPGWAGTPLGRAVGGAVGLPVAVIGDVQAHALGESHFGAGRGHESVLLVGVGTGIGGAYVQGGTVRMGAHGLAGHIGHMRHPLAGDLICSCGQVGHVEAIVSGSALTEHYLRLTGQSLAGREVAERAQGDDELARQVIQTAGLALGETLAGLVNSWDPHAVVLSGSVVNAGSAWWDALERGFSGQVMGAARHVPILRGSLGGNAPLLGAALNAQRQLQGDSAQ